MNLENKLKLPPGPWHDEADHVEFEHEGMPCLIHRNGGGVWCGYAAVPPGHPFHGKHYSDRVPCANRAELRMVSPIAALVEAFKPDDGHVSLACLIDVHGGLTYSSECHGQICHKAKPGEPDDVWWFGFDCGHSGDLSPAMLKYDPLWAGDTYRNQEYVTAQAKKLAEQLKQHA